MSTAITVVPKVCLAMSMQIVKVPSTCTPITFCSGHGGKMMRRNQRNANLL